MNVVLYMRYSSDRQTEQSIEGQQRVCTEYCNRQNYNIVDSYIDRALSASKNTEKREEFNRMIKDSEKGNFDAVIVYKLDRFARNRYDSAIYKNKLKKNGVRVISATENISDSPEGVILEAVLEGMAEFYSKELSQKVTRGMNETALKGKFCGGQIPMGYRIIDQKYAIDPLTAPIVKEAFERYASGETISNISNDFNNRGLMTSRKTKFTKNSFQNIFRNERYTGVFIYKDIKIENSIPAIISKDIFDKVQQRLKANAQAPAKNKAKTEYLLSQKLFCGHCNEKMVGESGLGKGGKTYNYYACSTKKRSKTCNKKNLPKDWIEDIVVKDALLLLTNEKINEIAEMAYSKSLSEIEDNKTIPAIRSGILQIDKSINNLLKLVEKGSFSDTLAQRLNDLENQKKDLNKRLSEEMNNIVILEKEHIILWLKHFSQGNINDINFKRQVIDMLVNSVTVWDEPDGYFKITTIYNLTSNNTKTLKFSDFTKNSPPKKCKIGNNFALFYYSFLTF